MDNLILFVLLLVSAVAWIVGCVLVWVAIENFRKERTERNIISATIGIFVIIVGIGGAIATHFLSLR